MTVSIVFKDFLNLKFIIIFMCMSFLPECLCTTCVSGAFESQKRELSPLEQELQRVVNLHMGAGN